MSKRARLALVSLTAVTLAALVGGSGWGPF